MQSRSRRPRRSPRRLSAFWQQALRTVRARYPHWGPKKIQAHLRRRYPRRKLPAVRTLAKWLGRLGPVRRARHSRRGPPRFLPALTQPQKPNDVWTVDFKGFFYTADGARCHPLTVRDLYSRFILGIRVLRRPRHDAVRAAFGRLFGRFGLPKVIRVDNGSPFGSTGPAGLSMLSVWWTRLGIDVQFIRPGCPQENGAHEQMHRELKRDTTRPSQKDPRAQQRRSDRWMDYYNHHRPHDALGGLYPADVYVRSRRRYRPCRPIQYPRGWAVRFVRSNGQIKWQGRMRSIGEAFIGQPIGLRRQAAGVYQVRLGSILLGLLHDKDSSGIRPSKPVRRKL